MKTEALGGAYIDAMYAQYYHLPCVSHTRASTPVCVHEPLVVAYRVKSRGETQHTQWSTLHLIRCLPQLCTTKIVCTPCTCKTSLVSIITLNSSR